MRSKSLTCAVYVGPRDVRSRLPNVERKHNARLPKRHNLNDLLAAAKDAGIFPSRVDGGGLPIEQILVGPGRFGNKRGRHGGGANTHALERDEAEAVVASAAVAITYIAKRLP
jgi:hypothetical protein